jgi:hypothetical protein
MKEETGKKILGELVQIFLNDVTRGIRSLSHKSSLELFPRIVELIGTDEKEQVDEAKKFIKDATDVLVNDLNIKINEFLKSY